VSGKARIRAHVVNGRFGVYKAVTEQQVLASGAEVNRRTLDPAADRRSCATLRGQ
jgi:hypothetical protein